MKSPHTAMAGLTVCLIMLAVVTSSPVTLGLAVTSGFFFLSLLGRHRRESKEAARLEAAESAREAEEAARRRSLRF
ncbi:hypothetical protein [Nocardioides sp. GY 10127]|uniref:hypothetical protein n=1 Tax=Nocardioides sp. GY 10127 TaxID=2569762 RepID=UPI0010A776C3|nr:hypothetical protein [Nocardioides sp. GY 10127]TIC85472.1 hypothetical protein E8D37_02205 [Nocardioides sp. GY 10127]